MPVSFLDPAKDRDEEKRIKSLGTSPAAVDEDDDGLGSSSLSEKSIMPGKRTAPIGHFFVTVRTLNGKEMGPFSVSDVATVDDVKSKVASGDGTPAELQRLFFEIPRHAGSVVGGGAHNLAPGIPATQIEGWSHEWPRVMQKRPLRKGRGDQMLRHMSLGDGFERRNRPTDSVALTAWLIPRSVETTKGKSASQMDYDDADIEPSNLEDASKMARNNLALRRSLTPDAAAGISVGMKKRPGCQVM